MYLFFSSDGRLRVGDELIKVSGRRIRGLTLQEARCALRSSPQQVEFIIARTPVASSSASAATSACALDSVSPMSPAAAAVEATKVTGMRKFSYRTEQVSLRLGFRFHSS